MQIVLLVIVLATVLPDFIIWNWIFPSLGLTWKMLLCVPTLIVWWCVVAMLTGLGHNSMGLRRLFSLMLILTFAKVVFSLVAWPLGWEAGVAVSVLVLAAIAYGFTFGWLRLMVRKETFAFHDLPEAFDGYSILQFSDLHLGTFKEHPEFMEKLVSTANEQHPDLMVFTGDLINVSGRESRPFLDVLSRLKAKDGILSILGNHDYSDLSSVINDERLMGWRLLKNEHVTVRRQDSAITIIGVEQTGRPPFESRGNLKEAMTGVADNSFKVLLTHDPSHWRMKVLNQTDIQLSLAGHTHAAQLKIGRFSPARWMYREWGGKYAEDGRILYVSLGLGGTMPFRLGAWPEINLITLKTKR